MWMTKFFLSYILLLKCININALGCCGSKSYRGVPRKGGGTSVSGMLFLAPLNGFSQIKSTNFFLNF